jgi:purine-binding chemotaxis protein CheW
MVKIAIFELAGKEYGVNITQIKQVIRMRKVTPVPEAAGFVEGVFALRGKVIPLINLRKKLGISSETLNKRNRIIVTEINNHIAGMVVDSVSDIISLQDESISTPDSVLKEARYLVGVTQIGKRIVLIVDMEKLMSDDLRSSVERIQSQVEIRKK